MHPLLPMNQQQHTLAELLTEGATQLGLRLSATQCTALLDYLQLLDKWSRVYNLTAVHDPRDMVTHHLLDSLSVIPHLKEPRVLDVGSGAGLPGIPLAVALPDVEFVLLDSVAKKTRFMLQAVSELGLSNVMVTTRRVEKYHPDQLFDTVISRAFSGIAEFVAAAGPHCRAGGVLLAMKGRYPAEELTGLPQGFEVMGVAPLEVPGLDEERHVVRISRHYSFEI